jgi:hypothetical protein
MNNEHSQDEADDPVVAEVAATRSPVTVRLYELTGLALIVPAPTGIVYVNQTGGHACYQCTQEGYLVPIGWRGEEPDACDALLAHFTGPKWSGWCNERIDVETADEIDRILSVSTRREGIVVDRTKLNDSWEAWVHLRISEPLVSLVDHAFPAHAILTWPNSD